MLTDAAKGVRNIARADNLTALIFARHEPETRCSRPDVIQFSRRLDEKSAVACASDGTRGDLRSLRIDQHAVDICANDEIHEGGGNERQNPGLKQKKRAASSTSTGVISVAQVMEMLSQMTTNPTAQQVLVAYLAGLGEATGMLVNASPVTSCKRTLHLDAETVQRILEAAAPDRARWQEIPATPPIVEDLIARGECRISN